MDRLEAVCQDIASMRIRGATDIARAAADGLAEHVAAAGGDLEGRREAAKAGARRLLATRPTAVSLAHGVAAVLGPVLQAGDSREAAERGRAAAKQFGAAIDAAHAAIAEHGASRVAEGRLLTHCHSSTVVDVLTHAWRQGKRFEVLSLETRPRWQGRKTAQQLSAAGIPVTLCVDGAAAHAMAAGIDQVWVGADAVGADGALVNKVGTRMVATVARRFSVPLFSAASRIKFAAVDGGEVPIEQRDAAEVAEGDLEGVGVWNPAFDVTPSGEVAGYVTESGILDPAEAVAAAHDGVARLQAALDAL